MTQKNSKIVFAFQEIRNKYLISNQGIYLGKYLETLDARTVVVERDYVDKDYLIDYSKFYARSFKCYERFTIRLHFFSKNFSEEDFKKMLASGNVDQLMKEYCGFVVIKPISDRDDKPLIGRTILKTYPKEINHGKRHFLTEKHHVSLYGILLDMDSLPYKTQDIAVGACATTAMWVSLYPLNKLFNVPLYSSYEITEKSVTLPSEFRSFPSEGLSFGQMINFIKSIGLDTEIINVEHKRSEEIDSLISAAVTSYLNCGLPIIVELALKKDNKIYGHHATVISGYRISSSDHIEEFYVHDDQIGPYSKAIPTKDLAKWKNEWITKYGYSELRVQKLLIPVYPKIRLSFSRIYAKFAIIKQRYASNDVNVNLLLEQVNSYKSFILKSSVKNKNEVLVSPVPRFLWIIRISFTGKPARDILFDGTSVIPKIIRYVDFQF